MAEQNNQAERAAFEAWAEENAIRTDLGAWDAWQARAALPASVDAVDLPPLPDKWELNMTFRPGGYCETDDAMEKMQAEIKAWREFGSAIAADRRKQALTQPASIGSIEDYAQFHTLHGAWLSAREYWQDDNASPVLDAWRNFIDYIDGRTAAIEAHNRAGKEQG